MEEQIDQESLVIQLRTAFLKQNLEPFDSRDISRVRNDDRVVLAYLKNCRFNREKAFNMMCESLKWRKSFAVNDISKESFSAEVLEDPYLYFKGYDKQGGPLLIWDVKRHRKSNTAINAELKKLLALLLDRREGASEFKKITMLFNMSGCGLSNIDYDFIKYLISLLTEYYPDILDNLLVFEMPRLLSAAWGIIKNMLDEDSRDAIKFVSKAEVTDFVEKDQLPVSIGGNNEAAVTNVMDNDLTGGIDKKQVTFNASSPNPSSTVAKSVTDRMGILQISPADTLTFSVVQSNSESLPQSIRMTNIKETQVAYKVKTTAPEHYRVKPTVGVIEPGQTVEVSVQLTPGSAVTASRDRFLVQSTIIASTLKGDVSEFWRTVEPGKVSEHRLRCKVTMNGSPIEEKVEMLNSTLHSMPTLSGGEDRLTAIENRLKAILESTQKTQKQVRMILTIIQMFLIVIMIYISYLLYQEYSLISESTASTDQTPPTTRPEL